MVPRWSIREMLLVIVAAALCLAAHRFYWTTTDMKGRVLFSVNLCALAIATSGAFIGGRSVSRWWIGYATFGWIYLICVLRGGFFASSASSFREFGNLSIFGVLAGFVCAIFVRLCFTGRN